MIWRLPAVVLLISVFCGTLARAAGPADSISFPSYGITLHTPAGWTRQTEQGVNTIAIWSLLSAKQEVQGIIRLEIQPAPADLKSAADAIAVQQKLAPTITPATLGRSDALEFTCSPAADAKPGEVCLSLGRVAISGKYAYTLCYFTPPAIKADRIAFEQMAASVTFLDPVAPGSALANRTTPVPLFDTGLVFVPPDPFRRTSDSPTDLKWEAFDFTTGKADATMTIRVLPNTKASLHQWTQAFTDKAAAQRQWDPRPTWTESTSLPAVSSSTIVWKSLDGKGQAAPPFQVIVAKNEEGALVLILVEYQGNDRQAIARYASSLRHMVRTFGVSRDRSQAHSKGP